MSDKVLIQVFVIHQLVRISLIWTNHNNPSLAVSYKKLSWGKLPPDPITAACLAEGSESISGSCAPTPTWLSRSRPIRIPNPLRIPPRYHSLLTATHLSPIQRVPRGKSIWTFHLSILFHCTWAHSHYLRDLGVFTRFRVLNSHTLF